MEPLYQAYIFHILIAKNYRSMLFAVFICFSAYLGLDLGGTAFHSTAISSIVVLITISLVLSFTAFIFISSFTRIYERFYRYFHLIWAFLITAQGIITGVRVVLHLDLPRTNIDGNEHDSNNQYSMIIALCSVIYTIILYITLPSQPLQLALLSTLLSISFIVMLGLINFNVSYTIANALLIIAANVVGIYFRYTSEVHFRRAFLKYKAQYTFSEKLQMAQKQSEYLLGMILPRKIIDTLGKYGGKPNARDKTSMHDTFVELHGVSILFADIVGFTDFSGKVNTAKLVRSFL